MKLKVPSSNKFGNLILIRFFFQCIHTDIRIGQANVYFSCMCGYVRECIDCINLCACVCLCVCLYVCVCALAGLNLVGIEACYSSSM